MSETEFTPQYGTEPVPKRPKEQLKYETSLAHADGGFDPNFHSGNKYDEDEGAGGEVYDLATGKKIDNSTSTLETEIAKSGFIEGELPPIPKEDKDEETDQWLAENDKAA